MAHHAIGEAITMAIMISFTKSFDNMAVMFLILAPNTFRIPISFVRCSAINAESANKPRQAMIIANTAKLVKMLPVRFTSSYILAKRSSMKVYLIGWLGAKVFHMVAMDATASFKFEGFIFADTID